MREEIIKDLPLLDQRGQIIKEGWARHPHWQYDPKLAKLNKIKLKEWNFYTIINQKKKYAVSAGIGRVGLSNVVYVSYVDFNQHFINHTHKTWNYLFKQSNLGYNWGKDHGIAVSKTPLRASFISKGDIFRIIFADSSLMLPDGRKGLDVNLALRKPQNMETLNIATKFHDHKKQFFLTQKANGLRCSGIIRRGLKKEIIEKNTTFAVMDRGRGNGNYHGFWYWISLSFMQENISVGIDLSYSKEDTFFSGENAIFFNSTIFKLDTIHVDIPTNQAQNPWVISSGEKLSITFTPIVNKNSHLHSQIGYSEDTKQYGSFSGYIMVKPQKKIEFTNMLGFTEKFLNRQ